MKLREVVKQDEEKIIEMYEEYIITLWDNQFPF